MTLADYTLPVPYNECKDLALVYSHDIAVQWYQTQQEHGDPRHVATAQQLPDGRWWLGAHLLSEVYPGGILGWAAEFLTPAIAEQIEVVPLADVLPQQEPA